MTPHPITPVDRIELELWRLMSEWDKWNSSDRHIHTDTAKFFVRRAAEQIVELAEQVAK